MATGPLAPVVRYLREVTSPAASGELPDVELLSRFARQRDEAAFTALVQRHGPMVLAVCRRVLRDSHTAEDAFQATFLILARKAGSLAQPELLGHWLHGVAFRTALKARTEAVRHRLRETQDVCVQQADPSAEIDGQDLRAVLDEEVNRLPERYRVPVVLCYLQGQTNAEAARRLGCSRGTVATLLARARAKLRRRLTQRGVVPSVGVALGTLLPSLRGEAVSLALAQGTAKTAALWAVGQTLSAGALASHAIALAKGVSKGMLMEKLKIPVAVLMMSVVMATGASVSIYRAGTPESEVSEAPREAKPGPQDRAQESKPLDKNRIAKPSRPQQAAPEARQPAPLTKHSVEELPSGPAPLQQVFVVLDKDGRLTVYQKVSFYQPVTEEVTLKSGRKTVVTTYEESHSFRRWVNSLDKVRFYDTKGRKIESKELHKRLKGETLALMSTVGGPIDPLHLRLYKEDTLVFAMENIVPFSPAPAVAVPMPSHAAPFSIPPVPAVAPPAADPFVPDRSTRPAVRPSGSVPQSERRYFLHCCEAGRRDGAQGISRGPSRSLFRPRRGKV